MKERREQLSEGRTEQAGNKEGKDRPEVGCRNVKRKEWRKSRTEEER